MRMIRKGSSVCNSSQYWGGCVEQIAVSRISFGGMSASPLMVESELCPFSRKFGIFSMKMLILVHFNTLSMMHALYTSVNIEYILYRYITR